MNTGSSGAARWNSVMEERSFTASSAPKISSALLPRGQDDPGALAEARSKHGVSEIGARLVQRGDGEALGHGALAETCNLREDEPDPVAGLAPAPKLLEHAVVDVLLRNEEAIEVVRHVPIVRPACARTTIGASGSWAPSS